MKFIDSCMKPKNQEVFICEYNFAPHDFDSLSFLFLLEEFRFTDNRSCYAGVYVKN